MGRAQLADPEFCRKAEAGDVDSIVRCIGCNQGCYDGFADKTRPHITCMVNPSVGREAEYELKPAKSPKTVLIAGGGPAGLESAIILKRRGHNPILCESTSRLGGQFLLAGEAPRKVEMKESMIHFGRLVEKMGVDVRMKTPVTAELIEEIKPDAVFCAIGAKPIILKVPGAELPNVADSHDVLDGRVMPKGEVVVIGGGLVGLEAAEFLHDKGCSVKVVEMLAEAGGDLGDTRKVSVMGNLYSEGIGIITGAKVIEIKGNAVVIEREGKREELPCDYTVVAVGAQSRDSSELEAACRRLGIAWFILGDAAKARRALNATAEAGEISRNFDDEKKFKSALSTKKVIFLTGASGTMGKEGMNRILERTDQFKLRILVRPLERNLAFMKRFQGNPDVEIVWGDLTNYADVKKCVDGADYVLHVAAIISPEADKDPQNCINTNLGGTQYIIRAIKEQPNADEIKLVYIGTVAETGDRMPPIHWGRCGDPINGSVFDYYAVSKIAAERAVMESGLRHWVSLRQTGIIPPKESAGREPIIFHQPPRNVLEWCTAVESGILLANVCEEWVPESFWRNVYNIGGGETFRINYVDYFDDNLRPMGFGMRDVFQPNWMALHNFHGQWYTDSDLLNDILHFRVMTYDQYLGGVYAHMQEFAKNPMAAAMMPTAAQMKAMNEGIAHQRMGTLWMLENNEEDWISAFFGSREAAEALPSSWEGFDTSKASGEQTFLNHGYDEEKASGDLTINDFKQAAEFRGGKCLSSNTGDFYKPLKWRCAFGHEFEASPFTVLKGGHWCPQCEREAWNYAEIAERNPFYNQVWEPLRGKGSRFNIKKQFNDLSVTLK